MRVPLPNFTQTPNDLFDHWLPLLNESELKVLMVIIRKTFGWHKDKQKISIADFIRITGLARQNVVNATKSLQEKGVIFKQTIGPNGQQESWYELIFEEDVIKNSSTSLSNIPPPVSFSTSPPSHSAPPPIYRYKERSKEIPKETTTLPPPDPTPPDPIGGGGLQSSILFYKSVDGGTKQILVSEVHRQFIRKNLEFSPEIIDQAIDEVRQSDCLIGNIISYLSSICARIVNKTYQNIKENKNLKTALISPKVDEKLPDIRCGKSVWEMMQEREKKNETI